MTDEELGTINTLDDGVSWAEGPLQNPKFKHFAICYALHALCTHLRYSLPDILRINNFSVEITLRECPSYDQAGNPELWQYDYNPSSFKEVLLNEVDSRPKGQTLEAALLQRCRDYFDDIADEVLAEEGISNIDRYLVTL